MTELVELDSLEILVIIDNELDPISPCGNPSIKQTGGIKDISLANPVSDARGSTCELRMDHICCSAHGLSLMITGVRHGQRRSILFDTGPEADAWARNVTRLKADIGRVEVIQLSHWHRDHSGGMLQALDMIYKAREGNGYSLPPVQVDLHPCRPDFRGMQAPGLPVVSLEADPSFEEIEGAKGVVLKHDESHTVLDNMFLVSGEIPRNTAYEKGLKFGVRFNSAKGIWEQDEVMADERILMCKLKRRGVVVFTGCSHAGVVNASKFAAELGRGSPLYAVVGGFHLADAPPELILSTVDDLKALNPVVLLAGHCTGWRAKVQMHYKMPGQFTPSFVGNKFVLS